MNVVERITGTVVAVVGITALTVLTIFADVDSQITVPAIASLASLSVGAAVQRAATNGLANGKRG